MNAAELLVELQTRAPLLKWAVSDDIMAKTVTVRASIAMGDGRTGDKRGDGLEYATICPTCKRWIDAPILSAYYRLPAGLEQLEPEWIVGAVLQFIGQSMGEALVGPGKQAG